MARSDTRMHIALISFIMMTILFAVLTFMFYRQASHQKEATDAAEDELNNTRTAASESAYAANYLKAMLGFGDSTLEGIEAAGFVPTDANGILPIKVKFAADMAEFGAGLGSDERNYPIVCDNLITTIQQAASYLTVAEAKNVQLKADADAAAGAFATSLVVADTKTREAVVELTSQQTTFENDRTQLNAQLTVKDQEIRKLGGQVSDTQRTAAETEDKLNKDLEVADSQIDNIKRRLDDIQRPNFEVPDGMVVRVNQRTGRAWINLGSEDGLRRQVMFSVYAAGTVGVGELDGKTKASIVVTEVLSAHLSEVRIIAPVLGDPLLKDDIIYSPIFQVGRTIHVALAGVIDLNDDGQSDHDLVRNMIEINGGVIDVALREDGTIEGAEGNESKITNSTRFLVIGDQPKSGAGDPNGNYLEEFSKLDTDADRNGALKIKLDDLLNFMGWKSEVRIVNLGKAATAGSDAAGALNAPARGEDGGAY
jgi:hypothetical protein